MADAFGIAIERRVLFMDILPANTCFPRLFFLQTN
jgi:hypothetical protein